MMLPRASWWRAEEVLSYPCRQILTLCDPKLKSSTVKADLINK